MDISKERDLYDNEVSEYGYYVDQPKDFVKGLPAKIPFYSMMVVVMELCERFAFYGASLMFTQYMILELGLSDSATIAVNRGFQYFCYFMAVIGAVVADAVLGKFRTIFIFGVWYMIGLVLLSISSVETFRNSFGLAGFILSTYLFMAVGTGGIKANVSSFMAEQIPIGFKPTDTPGVYLDSRLTTERGFRYFYWSINIGAFFGMLICPQVALRVNYPTAFGIPAVLFFLGLIVFVAGSPRYVKKPPQGTVLIKVYHCIRYALKNRSTENAHWLDASKASDIVEWDPRFVDGLRRSLNACKVFMFYPVYWALYYNMSDNFIIQGLQMRRPDWLSADQLNVVNSFGLIFMIPLFDNFFFPTLARRGIHLGPILRITIGFLIVTVSFTYVTILQSAIYKSAPWYNFTGADVPENAFNDISVAWQVLPYLGIGTSEIFASVTGLEYAFSQAPTELKAVLTGLFLFTNCGGSLIGMILAIWGGDPTVLYVFAGETVAMGIVAVVFYFLFRHIDSEVALQESYD